MWWRVGVVETYINVQGYPERMRLFKQYSCIPGVVHGSSYGKLI